MLNDYICRECCEEFLRKTKPRTCPSCGERDTLIRNVPDREKGEDDGTEYGDPRDARAERL